MAIDLASKKVERTVTANVCLDDLPVEQRKVREGLDSLIRAEAQFGLSFSALDLHNRIRKTLPLRPHKRRSTLWFAVEGVGRIPEDVWQPSLNRRRDLDVYPRVIPDAAIIKYQEAKASRLFGEFFVVEADYASRPDPVPDPWLVGLVNNSGRYIVLAYWE